MNRIARKISFLIENYRIDKKQFIIVSNNCWGYELYNALNRPYNTPFVGLFLYPECYVQFLENFDACMDAELKFSRTSKYLKAAPNYPVGVICGGIEIHFLHYKTQEEAVVKWRRRVSRFKEACADNVPIYVKFCDRDGCTEEQLERFHATSFNNKISFGIHDFDSSRHLCLPQLKDANADFIADGLILYRNRYRYFDISDWILSGRIGKTPYSRILSVFS
ncbi:MAG: DUF1919 domain-containing protein [Reinekea sp.]